jgi:O-antigen biosynthesis protein
MSYATELTNPKICASSYVLSQDRLNLVIPYVDAIRSFGGVASALRLFDAIGTAFAYRRIILTHQDRSEIDLSDWPGWAIDGKEFSPRAIAAGSENSLPVAVHSRDCFISAPWTSAWYVRKAMDVQKSLFPESNSRYVNFIQDYEPGFYPMSVEHVLVESQYSDAKSAIIVFNTRRLMDFFFRKGIRFDEQYVFEPRLHPRLEEMKSMLKDMSKERLIFVYARPAMPRNAFKLIVDGLRVWAQHFPGAQEWSVISGGDRHTDIDLGNSLVLRSAGKPPLDEWAHILSRCWIGISFNFLPHPAYSRLEIAEFGAWLVTNSNNSDISDIAPNIVSVDIPTPDAVAEKIAWCCRQYTNGATSATDSRRSVFPQGSDEFPHTTELVQSWRSIEHA